MPDAPLVFVTGIRGLNRVSAGVDLGDKVDDLFEGCIGDVWDMPAAEANVLADSLFGDAAKRMVQGVDA